MVTAGIYVQHCLQLSFYLILNISITACSKVRLFLLSDYFYIFHKKYLFNETRKLIVDDLRLAMIHWQEVSLLFFLVCACFYCFYFIYAFIEYVKTEGKLQWTE